MKRSATIALAIGGIAAAALLHVWVHLQVIAVGYDISRETKARHDLSEMNQRLALELRTRMDLAAVEKVAREQLKMATPDPRAIRRLPPPMAMSERRERSTIDDGGAALGAVLTAKP